MYKTAICIQRATPVHTQLLFSILRDVLCNEIVLMHLKPIGLILFSHWLHVFSLQPQFFTNTWIHICFLMQIPEVDLYLPQMSFFPPDFRFSKVKTVVSYFTLLCFHLVRSVTYLPQHITFPALSFPSSLSPSWSTLNVWLHLSKYCFCRSLPVDNFPRIIVGSTGKKSCGTSLTSVQVVERPPT